MELVIGTYEGLLLGYKISKENCKTQEKYLSKAMFIDNSHPNCIKALNVSCNNILSSAGLDEVINIIDLKNRVTIGSLVKHETEITCLKSFDERHLYASGKDGNISIWATENWNCEKILKGHLGPISSISLHPSGKLMLSLSHQEKKLNTWNLAYGKKAFVTNLNKDYDKVIWSPKGLFYLLYSPNHMQLYKLETAKVELSIKFGQKLTAASFLNDNILIVAIDKGILKFYNLSTHKVQSKFSTNQIRIKDIIVTENIVVDRLSNQESSTSPSNLIITASSEGTIKLFALDMLTLGMENVLTIDTSCRITCMALSRSNDTLGLQYGSDKIAGEPSLSEVLPKSSEKRAKKRLKPLPSRL